MTKTSDKMIYNLITSHYNTEASIYRPRLCCHPVVITAHCIYMCQFKHKACSKTIIHFNDESTAIIMRDTKCYNVDSCISS